MTPTEAPLALMTAEEFAATYDDGPYELIDGRVVVSPKHDPAWADVATPYVVRGEWPAGVERPPLTVVVRSPSGTWSQAFSAMARHLRAGEPAVLVLDPVRQSVAIFYPRDPPRTFGPDDVLTVPELPGLSIPVRILFEPDDTPPQPICRNHFWNSAGSTGIGGVSCSPDHDK